MERGNSLRVTNRVPAAVSHSSRLSEPGAKSGQHHEHLDP